MMQMKVERGNQRVDADAHGPSASAGFSQPWLQGYGNSDNSPTGISERSLRSTSENINVVTDGAINSQVTSGMNIAGHFNKDIPSGIALLPDGYSGQESQTLTTSQSIMSENHSESSQRELVGHSMVMASYPYQDLSYGAIVPPYGQQPLVHPHLYAVNQARMPLPLEMEEEPVYVNAKQYNGIMRRRQIRAKAELEKKVVKNKKPYLHESRHQHAMRRARGCGGRFLNTKKLNSDTSKSTSGGHGTRDDGTISNQSILPRVPGNLPANNSSGYLRPPAEPHNSSLIQDAGKAHNIVSFGNSNNINNIGHGRSSAYQTQAGDTQAYSSQLRESMRMAGPPRRAFPIT
uniref:Nuclear transcription factor Y subunit n=1 Tax=Kalanchoe fedtschenkoi TaxID=63787 RepID=A0A7N0T6B2_KALFE